jgi:L-ribulose-5-phosphate 3-epimerase
MDGELPSRRDVLRTLSTLPIAAAALNSRDAKAASATAATPGATPTVAPIEGPNAGFGPQLALVSRHLEFTSMEEGADIAAEAGYKSIAWSVRPASHILPENVERDLPRAVEISRKAGLTTPTIVTAIEGPDSPNAERVLRTMHDLGITRWRVPPWWYDYTQDLQPQWEALKPRIEAIAKLSQRTGTNALFHTESMINPDFEPKRGNVGGGVWDLWLLLKDYDPKVCGLNYDVAHAMVRGGTEWIETANFSHRHIQAGAVKDFVWSKDLTVPPDTWPWWEEWVVPGTGMVNFRDIFAYFKKFGFSGPIEVYYQYMVRIGSRNSGDLMNMLGKGFGKWQLEIPKPQYIALLKRDLQFYRNVCASIDWRVG